MTSSARDEYLLVEVSGASPQKLHLLLIEAAIRAAQRAGQQWARGENEAATDSLIRAQDILVELLSRLDRETSPLLSEQISAVYTFIHRSLIGASIERDEQKLSDALRVLTVERDTWRQVCRQADASATPPQHQAPPAQTPLPLLGPPHLPLGFAAGPADVRLSLEA